jgi:hypothetical protein
MATTDTCCTIVPYFQLTDETLPRFKTYCDRFVEMTQTEEKSLFYGFSFNGNKAHCREGYADAEGVLAHFGNVGELLGEVLKFAELTKLEIHGPAEELSKLKEPLSHLEIEYYTLEYGFRR